MKPGMSGSLPPRWALQRPKTLTQDVVDLLGAPLRMLLLPDEVAERVGLTSFRSERFAAVLPELRGRVLDVCAGDNALIRLHQQSNTDSGSVGVDVFDWGGDAQLVRNVQELPFPDASFDTVCFVACLNHLPERSAALGEAFRVLVPGGRVVLTMIGRLLGAVGHRLWWYSEDKHRAVVEGETGGLDHREIVQLLAAAGFVSIERRRFLYKLNNLYVAERPRTV